MFINNIQIYNIPACLNCSNWSSCNKFQVELLQPVILDSTDLNPAYIGNSGCTKFNTQNKWLSYIFKADLLFLPETLQLPYGKPFFLLQALIHIPLS